MGVFILFRSQRFGNFQHNGAFHPLAEQFAAVGIDAVDRAGGMIGVGRTAAGAVQFCPAIGTLGTGVYVAGSEGIAYGGVGDRCCTNSVGFGYDYFELLGKVRRKLRYLLVQM